VGYVTKVLAIGICFGVSTYDVQYRHMVWVSAYGVRYRHMVPGDCLYCRESAYGLR